MENDFIRSVLPAGLLDHFIITKHEEILNVKTKEFQIELHLEEKNELPKGKSKEDYMSKGFYKEKRVQDFPIRGKAVVLIIKRRRWRHKKKDIELKSDYSFIAKGVKLTQELADFLKGRGRDAS